LVLLVCKPIPNSELDNFASTPLSAVLPIVGNAAEHATAVTVSVKDKLTLSCQVAVGSAIQIAIFVIPLLVTIAWMMGKSLTLYFDPLESIVLLLSVLTVNYVVADGKSNWLEGCVLMMLYVIIGTAVYFYHGESVHRPEVVTSIVDGYYHTGTEALISCN
jgi:Ca2+/Na+ antiporter